ncbi:TolC family protein [Derxia gummosa]|uniref:TolC family protein n=1 Tax=Derxia gummosa DSM 723 TaxID=1121388 RepID=A0A8B6XB73_9BURK|nr:TolC family protein [Derxia gummosa]
MVVLSGISSARRWWSAALLALLPMLAAAQVPAPRPGLAPADASTGAVRPLDLRAPDADPRIDAAAPSGVPPAAVPGLDPARLRWPVVRAAWLERSRDLRAARRDIESAEADTLAARARPNPTLSYDAASISPRNFGAGSPADKRIDSTLRLEQPIERGDKRRLRMARADALLDASRADAVGLARDGVARVAGLYYDLAAAQAQAELAAQSAALADTALAAALKRRDAGDLAAADAERVRTDTLRARNDATSAAADLAQARLALARALAIEPLAPRLRADADWPEPAPDEPGLRAAERVRLEAALDDRPELRAARLRADAARSNRDLALAQRRRDVTVAVQAERYPGPNGTGNTVGLGVSIPLFLGYDYAGEIRSAEVDVDRAAEALELARADALAGIAATAADLDAAARRLVRTRDELMPAARRSLDAAEFAFSHGASNVTDVLDARRAWRAAEADAIATRADYARALAAWQSLLEPN